MTAVHGTRAAAAKLEITAGLAFYNVSQFLHLIEFPIILGKIIIYFHHCQGYTRKLFPFCVIISPYLTMRLLFSLQAERLRRYPCKNISFAQAFLYLSSHLGNHLIFRIQLESALVDGQLSGPVRHEKSCPPGTLRSASFLMACPAILEIGHCPRKIILTAISPLPFLTLCPLGVSPSGHVFGAKEIVLIHWSCL